MVFMFMMRTMIMRIVIRIVIIVMGMMIFMGVVGRMTMTSYTSGSFSPPQ